MHFDYAQYKQKGVAPILIVLLIAVLGIGGYFVYQNYSTKTTPTPTPYSTPQPSSSSTDETANWKTYENSKYGFSIKYPPELTYEEKRNTVVFANLENKSKEPSYIKIDIYDTKIFKTTLEETMKQLTKTFGASWRDIKIGQLDGKNAEINIGQVTGKRIAGTLHNIVATLDIVDANIIFSLIGSEESNQQFISDGDFYKMLSTFKFLDSDATAKPASSPSSTYTCPQTEYINCMSPIPDENINFCYGNYIDWAKANCPNFKGAAY